MSKSKRLEALFTLEKLHERYRFDLEKGEIFTRSTGGRADKEQHFKGQSFSNTRYRQVQVSIDGEKAKIAAHRMIWAAANGRWPADGMIIDHINSNTHDNRPDNLAEITQAENVRRASRK